MPRKILISFCMIALLVPVTSFAQEKSRPKPPDAPATGTAVPRESPPPSSQPPSNPAPPPPHWVSNPYPYTYPYGYWNTPVNCGYIYPPDGSVKFKIEPKNAQVFVDGGFVGYISDFDGKFQKLRLREGLYKIEFRADGYETFQIDIRVLPGKNITFGGELKKK